MSEDAQMLATNNYGLSSINDEEVDVHDNPYEDYLTDSYVEGNGPSYWVYNFTNSPADFDPIDYEFTKNLITDQVQARAVCTERKVLMAFFGNKTSITYQRGQNNFTMLIQADTLDTITDASHSCGSRCVRLFVLSSSSQGTNISPSTTLYDCNSTITPVRTPDDHDGQVELQMPDTQAQILAGSIA